MRYFNLYVADTNDLFTYLDGDDKYSVGDVVVVDFRNREKSAIIIALSKETEFSFKVNKIKRKVETAIHYNESYIKLLLWVKNYYLCNYSHVFNLGNSKKIKVKYISQYRLNFDIAPENDLEKELIKYFKKKKKIREVFLNKKFTAEEVGVLTASGILIFERVVEEKTSKTSEEITEESDELLGEIDSGKLIEKDNEAKAILSEEQEIVRKGIEKDEKKYFLIHGITGSGKTEVYLALMKKAYDDGKGSLFLVPEISLTPQMISKFTRVFGDNIAILHSKMTEKERETEWQSIAIGEKKIVIGVRSAIFAPITNLGYIIIDEEHETTYKQDTNPRYNAKLVAIRRTELEGCKLVLGSATPSVESYYYAEKKVFKLFKMENRFNGAVLPSVEIVDMKNEENLFFSEKLLGEIQQTLQKNEQVIILLNRKGYSTYIQCKDCGHVEECEHCSIKYSYYQHENRLKCNYCGISHKFTGRCSSCGSENLIHSGKGVERVAEELEKIFPVNIIKVDSDSSKEKDFHSNMYHDFLNGKYSIMIGTQMITKGFHFPNVTLVGVIAADMSLAFPDFRSGERTFQLLTQVSGRAGRGEKTGKVIIQTYQPENHIFHDIITADYENFYKKEIEDRQLLNYPPFCKIINIGISSKYEYELEQFSKTVYNSIVDENVEIHGPMKSLVFKVKDRFRYNIFIKGSRENINRFKIKLAKNLKEFENEKKFRIVVDIDPINLI